MPLYDFDCTHCQTTIERSCKIDERNSQLCNKCGNLLSQNLQNCNKKDWFYAHWNENFTNQPVFVESKEHMKKLCNQYGVYARCLM